MAGTDIPLSVLEKGVHENVPIRGSYDVDAFGL